MAERKNAAFAYRYYDENTDGNEQQQYFTFDANFNVTALISSGASVLERYEYDPYGNVTVLNPDFSDHASADGDYEQYILFAGYRHDVESGLYEVRNRMLHPTLGRWLQRDPLGYIDGLSAYEYVRSKSTVGIDPYGLATWRVEPGGGYGYADGFKVQSPGFTKPSWHVRRWTEHWVGGYWGVWEEPKGNTIEIWAETYSTYSYGTPFATQPDIFHITTYLTAPAEMHFQWTCDSQSGLWYPQGRTSGSTDEWVYSQIAVDFFVQKTENTSILTLTVSFDVGMAGTITRSAGFTGAFKVGGGIGGGAEASATLSGSTGWALSTDGGFRRTAEQTESYICRKCS